MNDARLHRFDYLVIGFATIVRIHLGVKYHDPTRNMALVGHILGTNENGFRILIDTKASYLVRGGGLEPPCPFGR
jgi:hypothetical protein